jgi:predicted NACHT family NTPase
VECTIVDFEEKEIDEFITYWISVLERQAQGNTSIAAADAETDRRELLDAIQQNPGVRQLASTPLLLTILALMKRQGVSLPERRVQLYDQYINPLLSTWNRARSLSGRAPGRDIDEIQTVRILAPLALWMHEISLCIGLVGREDMRRKLEELFLERGDVSPHQAARQFLTDVHEYAALLLERGPGEYGFIHLTFEEYLAAVALALKGQGDSKPIIETLSAHVGEQAWREVTLQTIGYLGLRQQLPKSC